jgi:hypothetical protein
MEAHIEKQKVLAEKIIEGLYEDVIQLCDKILDYAKANEILVVPDGVRERENQFHRYYVIALNFKETIDLFLESHPELTQRPQIKAYTTKMFYGDIWVCTLINGFYPIRNTRFKLPVGIRDRHTTSEIADLILLSQRAYNPDECSEWPNINKQIGELLAVCCKKYRPTSNPEAAPDPIFFEDAPVTTFWDIEASCATSMEKCLLISCRKRSTTRLMLPKSRWPGLLNTIREKRPGCSVRTTANTGRVPWDIRQESMLVEINGKNELKLYNNQDYELIPYRMRDNRATVDFAVYLRCIVMDIYLFEILDKQTEFLYQELALAHQKFTQMQQQFKQSETGLRHSGVHYPTVDFEQMTRLEEIRTMIKKKSRGIAEALEDLY